MKNISIYPGTFDPITFGHIDLLDRASRLFDKVIVAIARSSSKQPLFTLAERVHLAEEVLSSYSNVEIIGFESLLVDVARAHKANIILRGLRAVSDFDFEFQLANMNRCLAEHIESLFLMPSEKHAYVSSSMVREIAAMGGDVSHFVPEKIKAALKLKFTEKK